MTAIHTGEFIEDETAVSSPYPGHNMLPLKGRFRFDASLANNPNPRDFYRTTVGQAGCSIRSGKVVKAQTPKVSDRLCDQFPIRDHVVGGQADDYLIILITFKRPNKSTKDVVERPSVTPQSMDTRQFR
jgi:hypothetical protein